MIKIRACGIDDCAVLARFNKQLIEDERNDNPMSVDELQDRMRQFISSEFRAFFFLAKRKIVGYALVKMDSMPLYLRQFFICREHRRKGYGREAFAQLLAFFGADKMDIEVLQWNQAGIAFWKSLGFETRSLYMRFDKSQL